MYVCDKQIYKMYKINWTITHIYSYALTRQTINIETRSFNHCCSGKQEILHKLNVCL